MLSKMKEKTPFVIIFKKILPISLDKDLRVWG